MTNIQLIYPDGKSKALTFSYDDGVVQDKRLVRIFDEYSLKGTFNLNSKMIKERDSYERNGIVIRRLSEDEVQKSYTKHEIATHSYSHPFLTKLHDKNIADEIRLDKLGLETLTDNIIRGHAYPFGAYDDRVIKILAENFIDYARTTVSTNSFNLPTDFMKWHPTCHHNSHDLFDICDKFLSINQDGALFYIWGHSYEFDLDDNWDIIEKLCKKLSSDDDIWYAVNIEIYDYIKAFHSLNISSNGNIIHNPSAVDVFVKVNDYVINIKSGNTISIK